MTTPETDPFLAAVSDTCAAAAEVAVPFCVIGGVAVIAHGVPRTTADVDVALLGEALPDIDGVIAVFRTHGFEPRIPEAAEFARRNQVMLLRHVPSGIGLDASIAWLPFEREAIAHCVGVDFSGVVVPVPRAEDLLIYKLVAFRPRDLDDAEKLLTIHGSTVDVPRIRRVLREFCEALGDDSRITKLEEIAERILGRGR